MSILTVHATSYRGFSLSFQEGSGVRQPMSALGQKQICAAQKVMSALANSRHLQVVVTVAQSAFKHRTLNLDRTGCRVY